MRHFISLLSLTLLYVSMQGQVALRSDRNIRQLEEEYTTGLFKSDNAYVLVPMNDVSALSAITVFQYLQGRVPGLTICNSFTFEPVMMYRSAKPAFFLDEMSVSAGHISGISMNDIALVKVFRPPFIGAFGGGSGGAIAVYTRKGAEEEQ